MRFLLVVAALTLALTGCVSRVGGAPTDSSAPSDPFTTSGSSAPSRTRTAGPVDLVIPIEFRPVLTTGTPATTLPGEDGEELPLAEPIMTVDRLDQAEAKIDEHTASWVLAFTLTDEDARTFGEWTGDHIGERLAMVADDEVLTAPSIQGAITGGRLQITGDYTRSEAEDLLAKITGR